jgi:hypothetical protein
MRRKSPKICEILKIKSPKIAKQEISEIKSIVQDEARRQAIEREKARNKSDLEKPVHQNLIELNKLKDYQENGKNDIDTIITGDDAFLITKNNNYCNIDERKRQKRTLFGSTKNSRTKKRRKIASQLRKSLSNAFVISLQTLGLDFVPIFFKKKILKKK